jgi:hypothetical protein
VSRLGYRGVGGARIRENDEQHGRTMTARFAGTCADTGASIAPGDTISYDRSTRRTVLLLQRAAVYVSDVIETSGGVFYRNKRGRCEDAPCCGCCTI